MQFLNLIVVTPPESLPVTVAEFTDHARLNGLTVDRQPELITRELTAAVERAQQYLRRSLITQTLKALFVPDGLDCACTLRLVLPRGPVQSVDSVTETDGTVVDPATYTLWWNAITLDRPLAGGADVVYKAGYGDAGTDVPDLIREGILEYATVLYENRSGERDNKYQASAGRTLPAGVVDCWRPFQVEVSG